MQSRLIFHRLSYSIRSARTRPVFPEFESPIPGKLWKSQGSVRINWAEGGEGSRWKGVVGRSGENRRQLRGFTKGDVRLKSLTPEKQ